MEQEQKELYMNTIAAAIALVVGPRDQDYNKSGIGLRDYWMVNGIRSPLQMVDMKLKRALSQVGTWDIEQMGPNCPVPTKKEQVDKLAESMLDLINYAAFVVCEASSLYQDHCPGDEAIEFSHKRLGKAIEDAVTNCAKMNDDE